MITDTTVRTPEQVLAFWLEETGPEGWYAGGEALDAETRARFLGTWEAARDGRLTAWPRSAEGALAFLIVTDQFSRNMFRGEGRAFSTDAMARTVTKRAIERGLDLRIEGSARQFFYLPLEHSESLVDQDRAVRLIKTRMKAPETLLHARVHRQIIRMFGRFPFRNAALGRTSTSAEKAFLECGGYGAILREMQG